VELIHKVMDDEPVDEKSLPEEANDGWTLSDYVKTTRVILGKSLYSDSWLKL
jgi:hypothetical protein